MKNIIIVMLLLAISIDLAGQEAGQKQQSIYQYKLEANSYLHTTNSDSDQFIKFYTKNSYTKLTSIESLENGEQRIRIDDKEFDFSISHPDRKINYLDNWDFEFPLMNLIEQENGLEIELSAISYIEDAVLVIEKEQNQNRQILKQVDLEKGSDLDVDHSFEAFNGNVIISLNHMGNMIQIKKFTLANFNEDQLVVYPSLATNFIDIDSKLEGDIYIIDSSGKLRFQFVNQTEKFRINTTDLEPGQYFISLKGKNITYQNSFVKI